MGMAAPKGNRSLRLVVIDSDKSTKSSVRRCMADKGVRIIGEADDLKSGLRLVRGLQPDVILLELAPNSAQTMDAIKKIKQDLPDAGLILSSHESSPQLILSCIRAGAQEFITRPIDEIELDKAIDHLRSLTEKSNGFPKKRGTILSIFASKGGVGATTMVTNLGVSLANRPDTKTILVDLSFHMGDLGLMLDEPPRYSLTDAIEGGVLDESKLQSIMTQHSSGVYILTAVTSPEISDEISCDHMGELLGTLTTMFDYIIVDIGRHLDDRTVEVLEISDEIFLMSALDIPTIRNVSRYLDIFERLQIEESKIRLIVNRFQKKSQINLKDLESAVGLETFWAIPNDYAPISMGINGGNPAVLEAPRSKVAQSYKDLAEHICELHSAQSSPESMEATTQ
jgi:pilus assembly protein CpaE